MTVCFNDFGKFRYDVQGNFIDADKSREAILNSNNYVAIILTCQRILKTPSTTKYEAEDIVNVINRLKEKLWSEMSYSWKALALKNQGLAYETLGAYIKAIMSYSEALKINPKIGLKRKIISIQKKIDPKG